MKIATFAKLETVLQNFVKNPYFALFFFGTSQSCTTLCGQFRKQTKKLADDIFIHGKMQIRQNV
jgi:hypothetical protein